MLLRRFLWTKLIVVDPPHPHIALIINHGHCLILTKYSYVLLKSSCWKALHHAGYSPRNKTWHTIHIFQLTNSFRWATKTRIVTQQLECQDGLGETNNVIDILIPCIPNPIFMEVKLISGLRCIIEICSRLGGKISYKQFQTVNILVNSGNSFFRS